jgi:hypothetical protein
VGHDWPRQEEVPRLSLGTPSTEIFNSAVAPLGTITVALQVLKAIICCRQHTVAAVLQERLIHIMYASKWYHFCSGVCNVSKANILFPMDWK